MNSINPIADLPLGLGMALAQDVNAMAYFAALSPDRQRAVVEQTHTIRSRDEMHSFIHQLTGQHDL